MKKITILLTTALFTAATGFSARADSYNYVPYVGIDYVFSRTNAFGTHPEHHGGAVRLGSEYGKYFSTELFAAQSAQDKNNIGAGSLKTSYFAYGLDILAYSPALAGVALLATAGIGEYNYKTKFTPADNHREHGYGYRFGGGLKYVFDEHWQTRFVSRYINFDKLDGYNHSVEYSFGVEYHF